MKHTEEEIKALVIKILDDLDNDYYFPEQIYITFYENKKPLWGEIIKNAWSIGIGIPDDQFGHPDGAAIIIIINDDTGEVVNYVEGPGRPVPCTVKPSEEGKYEIHVLGEFLRQ